MQCSTLFIVLTGVLLYLVMGALVFNAIEAPYEESHHNELQTIRNEFLGNYTCVDQDHLELLINVSDILHNGLVQTQTTYLKLFDRVVHCNVPVF